MQRAWSIVGWIAVGLPLVCAGAVTADPGAVSGSTSGGTVAIPVPGIGFDWRPVADGQRGRRVSALAVEPVSGRLAIGDDQGARVGRAGGVLRRVLHRGPVRDLAFLPAGVLLAATERGLYYIDASGPIGPAAPGPGASARSVWRVAVLAGGAAADAGIAVAATDGGLFGSADGRAWRRLSGALPMGPATAVALARASDGAVGWGVIAGQLWRFDLAPQGGGPALVAATREVIAFAGRERGVVDVVADLPDAEVAVLFPQQIALHRRDADVGRWEIVRPELPAGATLTRLGSGAGGYWLASDRGLLVSTSLQGPWRRASPPAGTSAIWAAAGSPAALYVAASAGILGAGASSGTGGQGTAESEGPRAAVVDPPEPAPARSRGPVAADPPVTPVPAAAPSEPVPARPAVPVAVDPPIAEVHRVAIGYLGLGRARLEALRGRVLNRGWWPLVAVRGDSDWDRRHTTDHDQSFLSGEVRHLTDRDRDRGDFYGVSLTLSWDLGDIAYEPEVIDVSRETREMIELRDDVLDEITQLYFERRRILTALAAADPLAASTTGLRLRAAELAAGIDAWTGGWFSERVNAPTP